MSTDADALLDAVLDNPEDDLPRLVYADYCEEAGDTARAEFIRTQIELAKTSITDTRRAGLLTTEQELLNAHRKNWLIPKLRGEQKFIRGFVEQIWASAEEVVKHTRAIDRTPIRSLRVSAIDDFIPQLAKLPFAPRLRTFNLTNNTGISRYIVRLFGLGNYRNVKNLVVRNVRLWSENIEQWSRLSYFPKLTAINLSGNPIGDDGLRALANGPTFRHLKSLILNSDQQDVEYRIHPDGYRELLESRIFLQLETLSLNGNELGNDALDMLWDFDELPHLRKLHLAKNDINSNGNSSFEDLAETDIFTVLKYLDLSGNTLDVVAAHALATSPWMHRMDTVVLEQVEMPAGAKTILLESPHAKVFELDNYPTYA